MQVYTCIKIYCIYLSYIANVHLHVYVYMRVFCIHTLKYISKKSKKQSQKAVIVIFMAFPLKSILCAWHLSSPCRGFAHLQTSLTTAVCHECCPVLYATCRRWLVQPLKSQVQWFSWMLVACAEVKRARVSHQCLVSPQLSFPYRTSLLYFQSIEWYWNTLNPDCPNSHVGSFYQNQPSFLGEE